MAGDHVLAIDHGTQSVRALLFDLRGNLLAKSRETIEPYVSQGPGLAEQDPEVFWQALCQACQRLWAIPGVDKSSIAGVALTTQRATVINVDRNGRPLRPAIVWLDQRRTSGLQPVGGMWGAAFKLAGMSETVAYLQAEAEANWIRRHQPEIWANTHKYLFLSGYLTYRMTGRFVDAARALRIGLVSEVVPEQDLATVARGYVADLLAASPLGLRLTKECLNMNLDAPSLEAAIALEDRNQILTVQSADFTEGVRAFREKRPPVYRDA